MIEALVAVGSYLLGSIPTGYLFVRLAGRKDIRDFGSRSTGATNVLRVGGWKKALPVAVVDVLKGFLAVFLAARITADPAFAAACGLIAVVGHCFPVWIGFRGGKGVATALGAFAAMSPAACAASAGLFLLVVGLTRFVSLGSLLAALAFPAIVLARGGPGAAAGVGLAVAALVVLRHRGNIARLRAGTERRLGERSS